MDCLSVSRGPACYLEQIKIVMAELAKNTTTTVEGNEDSVAENELEIVKKVNTVAEQLREHKDEVVADRVLNKHVKSYIEEKNRMYLGVTKRHG
jgi:hypothetical protein